jgi:hypothetical protein
LWAIDKFRVFSPAGEMIGLIAPGGSRSVNIPSLSVGLVLVAFPERYCFRAKQKKKQHPMILMGKLTGSCRVPTGASQAKKATFDEPDVAFFYQFKIVALS